MKLIYVTIYLLSSLVNLMAMEQSESEDLNVTLNYTISLARLDYYNGLVEGGRLDEEYQEARVACSLLGNDLHNEIPFSHEHKTRYINWTDSLQCKLVAHQSKMNRAFEVWNDKIQKLVWSVYGSGYAVRWHDLECEPSFHRIAPIVRARKNASNIQRNLKPTLQATPVEKGGYKLRKRPSVPVYFYRILHEGNKQ